MWLFKWVIKGKVFFFHFSYSKNSEKKNKEYKFYEDKYFLICTDHLFFILWKKGKMYLIFFEISSH